MSRGRPPKFSTAEELEEEFIKWKEALAFGGSLYGEIPDVEGFCDFIGCWRDLLSEYEKKPDFTDAIKEVKNWIHYRKKQKAMAGDIPPAIYIFDAKNNAGYVDRQEVESREEITHKYEELTDEELDRVIKARQNQVS
jgi:hypothetical protein